MDPRTIEPGPGVLDPAPANRPTLEHLGWDPDWAAAFASFGDAGRQPARVVAAHRDSWVLASPAGDHDASVSGRLRHQALGPGDLPAVGDWVAAVIPASTDERAVIHAVLPRRSVFKRSAGDGVGHVVDEQVLAANIDVALLVSGLDGDFNERRIERYLAVAWSGGVLPVVVLNKADVTDDLETFLAVASGVAPGVEVRPVSALTGDGVSDLARDHLAPGRTAVVLGSSGVGKSTLVNALMGTQHMRTAGVREADSRGRHTTTHRELIRLPSGALLVDTPGIRSLAVAGAADGIGATFADLDELAADCRFSDCRHEQEPGCAVRAALADGRLDPARFERHRKLEKEAAHVARSSDRLLAEAERRKWRAISQSSHRNMAAKYGSDR